MKETFVDPETGWTVTRETEGKNYQGIDWIAETITDPESGRTLKQTRLADVPTGSIATWIREDDQMQEAAIRADRKRTQQLHEIYPELADGAEVPNGPLPIIKLNFAQSFATWGIFLPEDDVVNRRRGKICEGGWAIWYLFGSDEKGEYLDTYSAHRMTNDCHDRIYEDGRSECLPSIDDLRPCSSDPEEDARLKKEQHEEDLRVMEILEAKGFGVQGDEPMSVQIQRYQRLQVPEE
jgi:hypothetical protein